MTPGTTKGKEKKLAKFFIDQMRKETNRQIENGKRRF